MNAGGSAARVDIRLGAGSIPDQVRRQAGRIGFEDPVDAAVQSRRHITDLPADERGGESPIAAYHKSAARTIAQGDVRLHQDHGNGQELVFVRSRPAAAGVDVNLAATVEVRNDGSVWLRAFGWPDIPTAAQTRVSPHGFKGLARFGAHEMAQEFQRGTPVDLVMLSVLATALQPGAPAPEPAGREVPEVLSTRGGELGGYLSMLEEYSLGVGAGLAYQACLHRSAVEVLSASFLGDAASSLLDMELIEEVDDELRDRLPAADRLPEAMLLPGLPASHWWWDRAK
ncbi:hypothetical protein [Actinomadura violacea]|uniref:Uncharacterized protein n=1 Tax=Actinomadura violacea TaxID=2819934 RepID=A0ABS3SAN1_9ACTN|nr:hypothetical protein [Actinomadura violacea]MBO2465249.1 hypothetical protein [Actinomadura violacea]